MSDAVFTTIVATGFVVAFLHAAIPTHWLPFVLTARAQKWDRPKTLAITALAGCGHVLFTAILGFFVAWGGIALSGKIGRSFPWIAGGALLLFGLYYVVQQFRGKSHGHSHLLGGHLHEEHDHDHRDHAHPHGHTHEDGSEHGPRGGMLVNTGHGFIEISVFEKNVPPIFRLFFYDADKQPRRPPKAEHISIATVRRDGARQTFTFRGAEEFLESTADIPEPHEFRAIVRLAHGGHAHTHEFQFTEHDHAHDHQTIAEELASAPPPARKSDWAAVISLFALLSFSPCEGFIPVYVSGVRYGWGGFFLLTAILSVATIAGMVVFTAITLAGIERLKIGWLEKYESGVVGGLLMLLGLIVILFEH